MGLRVLCLGFHPHLGLALVVALATPEMVALVDPVATVVAAVAAVAALLGVLAEEAATGLC
jgi:hypothetical protein